MKLKFKRADGTFAEYGSGLGDWLGQRRKEIAEKEATDERDMQATADALVEEFAGACGVAADEYLKIESGEVDPSDEQRGKLAEALGAHGVSVTADDLKSLDEEKPAEESTEEAAASAGTEELRKATEAAQHEAKHLRAEMSAQAATLGENATRLVTLERQVAADAEFVRLGKAEIESRRTKLSTRLALRYGADKVPAELRKSVEAADAPMLAVLESASGLDPMVDPMCVKCKSDVAESLHRSSTDATVTTAHGRVPAATVDSGRERTRNASSQAATKYRAQQRAAGKTVSVSDAQEHVMRLGASEFWTLHDSV